MKTLMTIAALALASIAPAYAQHDHAPAGNVVSVPADDAVLAQAPREISLTFDHDMRLTSIEVHGPGHTDVPVAFTASTTPARTFTVPLPALAPGAYEVHWNGAGEGHTMEGTLHFTVQ